MRLDQAGEGNAISDWPLQIRPKVAYLWLSSCAMEEKVEIKGSSSRPSCTRRSCHA